MNRWLIYTKERFPILQQTVLISGMSLIAYPAFVSAFVGLLLFFFLLRAMDEYKDFDKDCVLHPERPLPRGLIARKEMNLLIHALLLCMLLYSLLAGLPYLAATLYLWAMFHEFGLKKFLSERPLLYALAHQLVIFPLAAFLTPNFLLVGSVLFGAFFAYEICRKQTYAHTPLLIGIAVLCSALGGPIFWPTGALLLCFRKEKFAILNLLACIYAIGIKTALS